MPVENLPSKAKALYEEVYKQSRDNGDSEEVAAKKAWAAVKRGWEQNEDGDWVKKKSSVFADFSMAITKVSYDEDMNEMRFRATASDTGLDYYGERMSEELFDSFVGRIKEGNQIGEVYLSALGEKGWDGGMPYLSISHYKSGVEGKNIPGDVLEVFRDGNRLKAKGTFRNTELGKTVFEAIKKDLNGESELEPIRISIGFIDFGHTHGENESFERKSIRDYCEFCKEGAGNKVYTDGQLVHLAFTRIPANERTSVEVERMAKTQKDDAVTIVGEAQADELEVNKSKADADILVEKEVKEDEPVQEEVKEPEATEEVAEETSDEQVAEVEAPAVEEVQEPEEVVEEPVQEPDSLDKAYSKLRSAIEANLTLDAEKGLQAVQPVFESFGETIKAMFEEKQAPEVEMSKALASVASLVKELSEEVQTLRAELRSVKQQEKTPVADTKVTSVPQPVRLLDQRSIKEVMANSEGAVVNKPQSISDIVKKFV